MSGRLCAWLGMVVLVALALDPVAAGEMARTDPGHLAPPPDTAPQRDRAAPMLQPQLPQVALRDGNKSWREAGKIDRALSLSCRRGRFKEVRPMLFRAIFSDDTLGVAFGHGLNLYDPDHLAKNDLIYLFRFAGTTACEVLTRKNGDARVAR